MYTLVRGEAGGAVSRVGTIYNGSVRNRKSSRAADYTSSCRRLTADCPNLLHVQVRCCALLWTKLLPTFQIVSCKNRPSCRQCGGYKCLLLFTSATIVWNVLWLLTSISFDVIDLFFHRYIFYVFPLCNSCSFSFIIDTFWTEFFQERWLWRWRDYEVKFEVLTLLSVKTTVFRE